MKRNCPICDCIIKRELYHQDFGDNSVSLMNGYDVCVCCECGFCYADNIPSQKEFDSYYAKMSKYEFTHTKGEVAASYREHFKKIFDFISHGIKNKDSKILDVGCSTGDLLRVFKENGYTNLHGMDPSRECIKKLREEEDIIGIVSALNDFETYVSVKFDVIILSAVLEHIVDLKSTMNIIKSLLKPRGILFIEVPNAGRFNRDNFIFTPCQQFSIEHINYFSHWSISNLLKQVDINTVNMLDSENSINQTIDPSIFVIGVNNEFVLQKEFSTETNLKEYVTKCRDRETKLKETIKEKLLNHKEIIVWGVSTLSQTLIASGAVDINKVSYFVDSNVHYQEKKINNKVVLMPEQIKDNLPILILSWSYQNEIDQQIKDMGLKNEVIKLYE